MTAPFAFVRRTALAVLPLLAFPAFAQAGAAPSGTSAPEPLPITDTIPAARDVDYPGTIQLAVDATDVVQGIFRVKEVIPVRAGPLTLLYPAWLPGNHNPSGPINKVAGLVITADGKPLAWRRDPVDVYAFHVDIPADVTSIDVQFQFLSAVSGSQGRIMMTPDLLNLQWNATALYPAGYFTRRIMVQPSATYPAGWTSATALRPSGAETSNGGTIRYAPVAFDTLVDSPVFAGRYTRIERLSPDVTLNIFADRPDELAAADAHMAPHRALVDQAVKLFGAQHYDHYDFLFAISDKLGGIGLEHHRSSENGTVSGYFKDWDNGIAGRDLLAHEYTHSWNGKFRRPADMWTPDFRTPMRGSLLWVYEGQTQFWGNVLAARAGLVSQQDALDALAIVAARYENQAGRAWRPVEDTTLDPIIAQRRPAPWPNWQRSEDYYEEGQLVWLDADSLIRARSGGKRSLDDFAKAFFGMRDRDWGVLTYTFDDVVAALKAVQPYDWAAFLHARIDAIAPHAPLDGLKRGGYRLVFDVEPTKMWKSREQRRKVMDLSYSLGLTVGKGGVVTQVMWDSPAFNAGLTIGTVLVAISGTAYSDQDLKDAITAAKGKSTPIPLLIRQGDRYRTVALTWSEGLRYPRLERNGAGSSTLDALYRPRK